VNRPVVAGVDGSQQSMAAARWAAGEAVRRGTTLRLLYAWPWVPHLFVGAPSADALQADSLDMLAETQCDLRVGNPGLVIESELLSYSTIDGLLAAGDDVELMVLGSRGAGGFEDLLVGSTSLAAAARANCPVVLVRAAESPEGAGPAHRTVVLGLDARHADDTLIDFALSAAARREGSLRVVHTWSLPPLWSVNPFQLGRAEHDQMQEQETRLLVEALHGWSEKYPGLDIRPEVRLGPAAKVLVEAGEHAALLVVGRHTRRPALGLRLGPVAHAVIHHAACPVAVVPHG